MPLASIFLCEQKSHYFHVKKFNRHWSILSTNHIWPTINTQILIDQLVLASKALSKERNFKRIISSNMEHKVKCILYIYIHTVNYSLIYTSISNHCK